MRKAGNLDERGLPVYTLDERRFSTADVHENRYVRGVVDEVRQRVLDLLDDGEREAILSSRTSSGPVHRRRSWVRWDRPGAAAASPPPP